MSGYLTCRQCGARLSSRRMQGICPACLARRTLDTPATPAAWMEPGAPAAGRPGGLGPGAGVQFGDYELLEEIGRGGMGVVYKARQRSLGRLVALKLILSGRFAGPESVRRFRAEARAAAALRHPNIVAIHEVGEQDGQPFFSMDYVEGRDLAEWVGGKPLEACEAARCVRVLAEAIHYAHERGILHRDIKPSNVLIDGLGRPCITDFGLAKQLHGEAELTVSGQALGSPQFSPPEQAAGLRDQVGPPSDVYGLGAVLYHLLTGRPPFVAGTMAETLVLVQNEEPVSPSSLNPSVPADLQTICLKCLEKESRGRYATARDLAEDLARFEAGDAILARPIGPAGRLARWCRRKPVVAGLAAMLVVVFWGGLSGVLWQWTRAERHAANDSKERIKSTDALTQLQLQHAETLLREDQPAEAMAILAQVLRLHPTNRPAADRLWWVLNQRSFPLPLSGPMQHAQAAVDAGFSPDDRWVVTASADGTARVWDAATGQARGEPLSHTGPVHAARFSPDGRRILTASEDGTVKIWEAQTGQLQVRLDHPAPVTQAQFGPDGSKLFSVGADRKVRVWDVGRGVTLLEPIEHEAPVREAHFGPVGTRLVTVGSYNGDVRVHDCETGSEVRRWKLGHWAMSARLSPDEAWVLIGFYQGYAGLWEVVTGREAARFPHEAAVWEAVFSPDGRMVATVSWDRRASLWDAHTGERLLDPLLHSSWVVGAEFSGDGLRLLTRERSTKAFVWDVLTGRRITEPIAASSVLQQARFDRAGRRVVTAARDGLSQVWNVQPGAAAPLALDHSGPLVIARFSPDGSQVAAAGADQDAGLWDAATGRQIHSWQHRGQVLVNVFSPDGRRVLTAGMDHHAQLWDAQSGQRICQVQHRQRICTADFSPDGTSFVTGSFDGTARVWAADTGAVRFEEGLRHEARIWHVAFSRDGKRVVTGSTDFSARIWDAASGEPLTPPLRHQGGLLMVEFSPDDDRVLSCDGEGWVCVWDAVTGQRLADMRHHAYVASARFSPRGRRVVTASYDNTAQVWDGLTGRALTEPMRHQAEVCDAVFSPDARYVATGSMDGTARLWDAETGKPVSEPIPHGGGAANVGFSPNGRWLLVCGRAAQIWALPPGSWPAPDWLGTLAGWVGRSRLDDTGHLLQVEPDRMASAQTAGPSGLAWTGSGEWSGWARWFLGDRTDRTLSWAHEVSLDAMSRRLAAGDALGGLREAVRRSPWESQAWSRLAQGLARSSEVREEHRRAQVHLYNRRGHRIPPRDPATPGHCLDLSMYYNAALDEDWHGRQWPGNNLASFPPGRHILAGTEFDARGIVQLNSAAIQRAMPGYPRRLTGIRVGRQARSLHFLHAAGWGNHVPPGTTVGQYLLHYRDGQSRALPIVTGEDLLEWQAVPGQAEALTQAVPAWTGTNARHVTVRLFKRTCANPRPETEIETLDFESTMTAACPFLVALTLEP